MKQNKSVWLVYDRKRFAKAGGYYERYIDCFLRVGYRTKLVFAEDIAVKDGLFFDNGAVTQPPDIAVMRTYNLDLTLALEQEGVKVFNNSHVAAICNDKYKTYEAVSAVGIEVPSTKLYKKSDYYKAKIQASFPAVLKSLDGHGGTEVFWIANEKELDARLPLIKGQKFILQKPVSTLGRDIRIYVVGKAIIAAMLRYNDCDFRSNFCLGGDAMLYVLNEYERKMAQRIIALFDFGMVGIDFVFDGDRPVFNEIEDIAGARTLYKYTDIDIVKLYTSYIVSATENRS